MKIVLIDAHALIHRAYHALPDFSTATGEPTGALYGLSLMILRIISDFNPDYIIACYDRPEKTHRHDSYKDYKGTRKKLDEALIKQLNTSKEIFEALKIPIYDKAGFEADDILGTLVEMLAPDGHEIIIASGDMDTMQLVERENVKVFTLKKGIKDTVLYDRKAVLDRYGFLPDMIPDYKGLRGDPSDNIPGIAGIGEKTATSLISKFGSIENIYKELSEDEGQFKKAGITDRIINLLKEGKDEAMFSKVLGTIRRDVPIEFVMPAKKIKEEIDGDKAEEVFKKFEFRTLGIKLKEVLGKDDLGVDKEKIKKDDKDSHCKREVGILVSIVNSAISNPTIEDLLELSGEDTEEKAVEALKKRIKEENLTKIYELELALIPVIEKMEKIGVKIDIKYLKNLGKKYHDALDKLTKEIYTQAGTEFNINSPKQLGEVLFDKLELTAKGMKKTAGGARSTKESELLKLKDSHPIISNILEHRELSKLLSTYIDCIPDMVDKEGRLHTSFLQMGAATGRMSSINPNLQNIPIKTELGRAIRNAFIAEDGYCFAAFDYSQFELRIAAFLSGDEKLIEIFKNDEDVHSAVSSQVFKVPLDQVTKDMRRKAKVINFGILYGMGVNALRANLGSTKEEAEVFLSEYFKTYSTLATYLEKVKRETLKNGFTTTFFGRRRYFPEIKSKLPHIRASAERMAINAPIQGTLADLTKLSMINIDEYIKREKLDDKVHLLIQVHDELDYEVHESVKEKVVKDIKKIMEEVLNKNETNGVPIIANSKVGKSWGELT